MAVRPISPPISSAMACVNMVSSNETSFIRLFGITALIAPFDVFACAQAALAVSRVCIVVGGVRAFAAPVFGASVARFDTRDEACGACVNVVPRGCVAWIQL